jgi:DNA-binding NtrC family response regulator
VLVVDDEPGVRSSIARVLRKAGMVLQLAEGGEEALAILETEAFDVALLDVRMPGMTGPQLLERMKAAGHSAEVVMMTAYADSDMTVNAVRAGAYAVLTKPFAVNQLIVIGVGNAARHKRQREQLARLQRELEGVDHRTSAVIPADLVAFLSLEDLEYMLAKRRVLSKFRRAYVVALLRQTGGDMSEAARRAGLRLSLFETLARVHTDADAEE